VQWFQVACLWLQDGAKVLFQLLDHLEDSVRQLVAIIQYYGFDGWLVNIECSLPIDVIPKLQLFVCACRITTDRVLSSLCASLGLRDHVGEEADSCRARSAAGNWSSDLV
jgi:hypothetical protein